MKRFNFKLQQVLELRAYRENEAKVELGRAVGILTEIENRITLNAANRGHAAGERFSGGGMTSILHWNNYILRLEQEAETLAQEAAQAQIVVEEKRADYLDASREVKVLEKLKEKRGQEYRKEYFAAETAELDDIWKRRE